MSIRIWRALLSLALLVAGPLAFAAGPREGRWVTPSGFSVPVYGTQLVPGADGRLHASCGRLSQEQIEAAYGRSQTVRATMDREVRQAVQAAGVPFTVVYTDPDGAGFNDPVVGPVRKAAFEAVAAAWSNALGGAIPIVIDVRMETDDPNTLASASPTDWVIGEDRVIPLALAAQLNNASVNDGRSDLLVRFNPNHAWDYDLSGNAAPGMVSFVYTALHEVGHGLGFLSLFSHETGQVLTPLPSPFDLWMNRSQADGNRLTARAPEQVLEDLRSGDLYFAGPNAVQAGLASVRPLPLVKLYAPAEWEPGSSASHVDQETYSDPSVGLMRPSDVGGIGAGVVDALTAAVMLDLGYPAVAPVVASASRR